MKWIIRTVGLVIMVIILGIGSAYAAENSPAEIEIRLKKLEQDMILARGLVELSKELRENSVNKMFEEFKRQYEQEIKSIHNEQDKFNNTARAEQNEFKNDIKQQTLVIMVVWVILGAVGMVTLISVFITLFRSAPKWIKAAIEERIGEITDIQKEHIRQIVDEKIQENRLKKDTQLLLLSAKKEHKYELEHFFEFMGFKMKSLYFDEAFDLNRQAMERTFKEDKHDLIIFNRLSAAEIDAYMEKSSKNVFMAYAPYTKRLEVKARDKMNFANSPFTIYSRTMETLQYQEFIKA